MDATPHHFHWFLRSAALPVSLCCLSRSLSLCLLSIKRPHFLFLQRYAPPSHRTACHTQSASTILKEDPSYFTGFSCVVATDLDEDTLLPLAALLWESKIPLLVGRAYGMIG